MWWHFRVLLLSIGFVGKIEAGWTFDDKPNEYDFEKKCYWILSHRPFSSPLNNMTESQSPTPCHLTYWDKGLGHLSSDGSVKIIPVAGSNGGSIPASKVQADWYEIEGGQQFTVKCVSQSPVTLKFDGPLPNNLVDSRLSRSTYRNTDGQSESCFQLTVVLEARSSATGPYTCSLDVDELPEKIEAVNQAEQNRWISIHLFIQDDASSTQTFVKNAKVLRLSPNATSGELVIPCFATSPHILVSTVSLYGMIFNHSDWEKVFWNNGSHPQQIAYHVTKGFTLSNGSYDCGDSFYCASEEPKALLLSRSENVTFEIRCTDIDPHPPLFPLDAVDARLKIVLEEQRSVPLLPFRTEENPKDKYFAGSTLPPPCNARRNARFVECHSLLQCEFLKPCLTFSDDHNSFKNAVSHHAWEECRIHEMYHRRDIRPFLFNNASQIPLPNYYRGFLDCSGGDHSIRSVQYMFSDVHGNPVFTWPDYSSPDWMYCPDWISIHYLDAKLNMTTMDGANVIVNDVGVFYCVTTKIYGSSPVQWVLEFSNGSQAMAQTESDIWLSTNGSTVSQLVLKFTTFELSRITCRCPNAKSLEDWFVASINVTVDYLRVDGPSPVYKSVPVRPKVSPRNGCATWGLECKVFGNQTQLMTINWHNNGALSSATSIDRCRETIVTDNSVSDLIQIYYYTGDLLTNPNTTSAEAIIYDNPTDDVYTCVVTDYLGRNITASFFVEWYEPFPFEVLVYMAAGVFLTISTLGIFRLLRNYWRRQYMGRILGLYEEFKDGFVGVDDTEKVQTGIWKKCSNWEIFSVLRRWCWQFQEEPSSAQPDHFAPEHMGTQYVALATLTGGAFSLYKPYDFGQEIPGSKLTIEDTKPLGSGEDRAVYRGSYKAKKVRWRPVAIKKLEKTDDFGIKRDFLMEVIVMQNVGIHQNIVKFIGAVTKRFVLDETADIVMELCERGSIPDYLESLGDPEEYFLDEVIGKKGIGSHFNGPAIVNTTQLFIWAYQVASGMEYLHSKGVIHRDLAARNVLLDHDLNAKITDFGMARSLKKRKGLYQQFYQPRFDAALPLAWMPPESWMPPYNFTPQSDVWAFGVTLFEIFNLFQEIPYQNFYKEKEQMYDYSSIQQLLQAGKRLEKPKYGPQRMYDLVMASCWHEDQYCRPVFGTIKIKIIEAAACDSIDINLICGSGDI